MSRNQGKMKPTTCCSLLEVYLGEFVSRNQNLGTATYAEEQYLQNKNRISEIFVRRQI